MAWVPADRVFRGGTEEVKALYGRRVRSRMPVAPNRFHGVDMRAGDPVALPALTVAFVGRPVRDMVVLAVPTPPVVPGLTLAMLERRGVFTAVLVNWPTLRTAFEIET
jgi:hypothetical protein